MRWLPLLVLFSCRERPEPAVFDAGALPPKVAHVVVTTGPFFEQAPRFVERWRTTEGWPQRTLVLSTGFSSVTNTSDALLEGAATATLFKASGGAAFTAGPPDLAFGSDTFSKQVEQSAAALLLANVRATDFAAPTVVAFEREKIRFGVIGISTLSKSDGAFEALPLEGALKTTIATASSQAQVVVGLVNGCSTEVRRALEQHPDWKVDLVVAAPCEGARDGRVGTATLLHPSSQQYASLRVELGAVRSLSAQVVDVAADAPEEPSMVKARAPLLARVETLRARPLVVLKEPADVDATTLMVATALKTLTKADAGLFSKKSLQRGLPATVTRAAVLESLPSFERVLLVDVPGEVLTKLVSHPDALLSMPAKVDPNGSYVLATTESLYRSESLPGAPPTEHIGLEAVDANPVVSTQLLPTAVMAFLETAPKDQPLPRPPKKR
ncbi:MAG: hypothetical protein GQE15_03930 [Archangiaceae bacterium]|nr:hypothetical protein [Archangiaceae bacterium]